MRIGRRAGRTIVAAVACATALSLVSIEGQTSSASTAAPAQAQARTQTQTQALNAAQVAGVSKGKAPRKAKKARRGGKVAYLTFDDGPNARFTPQVLSLLKQYNAKATFFMIGSSAKANPALVRRVRAQGHAIGNHTYSHPWLNKLSAAGIRSQLTRTDAVIGRTTCMRPPGGFVNNTVRKVARSQGKSVVMWSVDTRDWARPGAGVVSRNALRPARNGSVILMHDGGGPRQQTIAGLRTVLKTMTAQGYRFEKLPACR